LDALNQTNSSLRTLLGDIMLVINVIAPFLSSVLIFIKMALILRDLYLDHKKSKKDKLAQLNIKASNGRFATLEGFKDNQETLDASSIEPSSKLGHDMEVIDLDKSASVVNYSENYDLRGKNILTESGKSNVLILNKIYRIIFCFRRSQLSAWGSKVCTFRRSFNV